MIQASHALASLPASTGVAGPARREVATGTGARSPRRARLISLALLAGLALLGLAQTATPALATTSHTYAGQFGSAGTGGGAFTAGGPSALGINQSSGDIFALDSMRTNSEGLPAPRIERFNAGGEFQGSISVDGSVVIFPSALAYDPVGAGSLYVGGLDDVTQTTGTVLKYSVAGALDYALNSAGSETSLGSPVALAVDPGNGTVYVNAISEATGLPAVDEFDKTGTFVTSFDGSANSPDGGFGAISALAVDASHRLYVSDGVKGRLDRYSSSGEWQATVDDGSRGAPGAIAVDPTSSEIYVLESGPLGEQVTRFSAGGAAALESFGAGHITSAAGLAVTHSSGAVYTVDTGISAVERFTTFLAPNVTTEAASQVEATEASLNGTINPEGVTGATTYRFEYGPETSYGASTPETDTGGGSSDIPASATIMGLTPGTTYHYRLVGTNGSGSSFGGDETLTTAAAQVLVDLQGPPVASAIRTEAATLGDFVNPDGADTTYRYEYGPTAGYGNTTPDGDVGAAVGEAAAATTITGLQPGRTYHFRIVAENGTGAPVDGADATFTTAPGTPPSASEITSNFAALHATVIPGTFGASYHFEYGTDLSYGTSTPERSLSAGEAEVSVSADTLALAPGTLYHFRLVATIKGQSVSSNDATFTTISAATVTTAAVTEITPTTATLNASIDTHGVAGTYGFTVTSPDSPYAATTADAALSATSGPQAVSVTLTGLPAGAQYGVQASASVAGSTIWGGQVAFSTPELPPFSPPTPPPSISATPYGCAAPHLDPVNAHPEAGAALTVSGSDLGIGGTIALGAAQIQASSWSPSAITFAIPEGSTGTQPLTINCGAMSNTVGLAILQAPSNTFSITKVAVKGSTATLSVKVPGPGKLQATSAKTATVEKAIAKASATQLTIHLRTVGKNALARAKSQRLPVSARISFTPTGGTVASQIRTITFKRGGTR